MKLNYFFIPLIVLGVALLGSYLTASDMEWYKTLILPKIAPPGSFIGIVWTIIFILSAISALIYFNLPNAVNPKYHLVVLFIFGLNAILNIIWSYLFFTLQLPGAALIELVALDVTVFLLIFLIWPASRAASILLIPYGLWVTFAGYLNYLIWALNK